MRRSNKKARAEKAKEFAYGERKEGKQFMLTPAASDQITRLAEGAGLSRSETLERLLRLSIEESDEIALQIKQFSPR
ncbi:MAG: hypothetical protein LRZ84_14590 [Desertifilum sp.]|nr:hypothetical protein [Desertifilum sp.]